MNLGDLLETIPDDRIIYVGAKSGFLVAGTKQQVKDQIPEIDKSLLQRSERKRDALRVNYRSAKKNFGKEHEHTKEMLKMFLEYQDAIPMLERVVIDWYERQEEDAINIIISGEEQGDIWSLKEGERIDPEFNFEDLTGAIIRIAVQDYKESLKAELLTFKSLIERLERYRNESKYFERYLQSKNIRIWLGSIEPEYIINKARKDLAEMLVSKSDKNNKKRPDALGNESGR